MYLFSFILSIGRKNLNELSQNDYNENNLYDAHLIETSYYDAALKNY